MPGITILLGVVLMIIGIGTYAMSNDQPFELLLPAIFGLLALGLGIGSIIKKDLKMHLMHAAVLLAALGVLVPIALFIKQLADLKLDEALRLLATALSVAACGGYVYAAVQSFRAARRNRKDDTPAPTKSSTEPVSPTDPA